MAQLFASVVNQLKYFSLHDERGHSYVAKICAARCLHVKRCTQFQSDEIMLATSLANAKPANDCPVSRKHHTSKLSLGTLTYVTYRWSHKGIHIHVFRLHQFTHMSLCPDAQPPLCSAEAADKRCASRLWCLESSERISNTSSLLL